MKKTRLVLAFVLCCVAVVSVVGCEKLATTATTTTAGPETTLTAGPETTLTAGSQTTITTGPETTTTAGSQTTTTVAPATTTTKAPATTTTKAPTTTTTNGPAPQAKLLTGTSTWDVDGNVNGAGAADDLYYDIVDELVHYLQPVNGAGLARMVGKSFAAVSLSDLMAAPYTFDPLATEGVDDPNVLMPGDVIALLTNGGVYVKIEVAGFEAETLSDGMVLQRYNMRLQYVAYPN